MIYKVEYMYIYILYINSKKTLSLEFGCLLVMFLKLLYFNYGEYKSGTFFL